MYGKSLILLIGLGLSASTWADDSKLHFLGNFETGNVRSGDRDKGHDWFYVATLPDPQVAAEIMETPKNNFGPDSNGDTHVVRSDVVDGETIKPRKGTYFLRSEVYHTKNYLDLNGYVKNRPRSKIYMSDPENRIDFDQEGFVGFSIYTPHNFENETAIRDHRGAATLFTLSTDSSRTLVNLGVWVESPSYEAHWFLRTWTSDTSILEANAQMKQIDLGPVSADKGKWTDFVFRYRFNPFSVSTNPAAKGIANSKDQTYPGNKGILQVWKAEGAADPDGNRKMTLMVDKVNTPVGLVPPAVDKIIHHWRIYKFGWLSNPTSLTHPVWFGFDEIRQGLVARDGTTFADVAPSGAADCVSDCGSAVASKPKPPSSLAVN